MKKIWLSTLLKFYAYVMVVILTIMGLVVAGISWKNQQAEADRIAQRVLTEVVTDLETSYQRVTQEGRSLVENPAKLEGVYRYFTLSPSEYETWRLNAQFPSYIQLSLHKNIDSLYLSNKTSRVSMSPCLITRRYLSLPGNHRRQASLGGPLQGSCDSHSGSFDRSDYGCWSWDCLYDPGPRNFDGSD